MHFRYFIKETVQRSPTIKFIKTTHKLSERLLNRTERVMADVDPARWHEHYYGLPTNRWSYFKGKSNWITGAGTGYGRALACALAAAGAQIFLTGRRVVKLQETIQEIASLKIPTENCHVIEGDITDPEQINRACTRIRGLCPALDGLVNNAAINDPQGFPTPLQLSSPETWNLMMNTNITAQWLITRSIWPHLHASGHVRVLFISSKAGWESFPGSAIYNVTKAALNSLTHSIAAEYAHSFPGEDIQINALVPGHARTEMNPNATRNPYQIVSMAFLLLSQPRGGTQRKVF